MSHHAALARYLSPAPGASLEALALSIVRFAAQVEDALCEVGLTTDELAVLTTLEARGAAVLDEEHACDLGSTRALDGLVERGLVAVRRGARIEVATTRDGARALARARARLRTLEDALDDVADPRELAAIAARMRAFTDGMRTEPS